MKNKLLRWTPVLFWMLLMFALSSRPDLPTVETQQVDFFSKKAAHVIEYFILNLLWYRALGGDKVGEATIFSLIYAFTDETHQLFIPNRTGKLRDVGIDFIGISAAALLLLKFPQWKNLISLVPTKKPKK